MPEISESDLQEYEGLRTKLQRLAGNKEARKLLEKAWKQVEPNARTPALDEDEAILAPVKAVESKLDKFIAEENERKAKEEAERKLQEFGQKVEQEYAKLRAEGWTDEGIAGVKKIAEEKSLMPLDASAIFLREHPPQEISQPRGYSGPWNFMEPVNDSDKNIKSLIESKGDSENVLNRMIHETLSDVRGTPQLRR